MRFKLGHSNHRDVARVTSALLLLYASFARAEGGGWTVGGADVANSHFQQATSIGVANVSGLRLKWKYKTGGDVSATPAVVNGVVYFPDWAGNFYAVDAKSGSLIWQKRVSDWTGVPGDFSRNSPAVDGDILVIGDQAGRLQQGAWVIALNRINGNLLWKTKVHDHPASIVTSSPSIFDGRIYVGIASTEESLAANNAYPCCSFRGKFLALDEHTGGKIWETYMVPDNGNKPDQWSGAPVWGTTPAINRRLSTVSFGTGNDYRRPAGCRFCDNPGNYFDAIVSLDLLTGRVVKAQRNLFRLPSPDAWNSSCPTGSNCPPLPGPDYDFGAAPNLITLPGGQDRLLIGEKSGSGYSWDPVKGSIVWRVRIGPGSDLGGVEWGTATDGRTWFVPISNRNRESETLISGKTVVGGYWSALDVITGKVLWQTPTPDGSMALAPVTLIPGVLFAASMDPSTDPTHHQLFALDALSGKFLWSYGVGSSVNAAPAVADDSIYWGTGYNLPGLGTGNSHLYAFYIH